jgi:hypothetical protein
MPSLDLEPTTAPVPDPTPRTAARIAGYSYMALFALGIFGNFFVRERLVERGDATATFQNVADAEGLLRLAIVAFTAAFVLDVVVAWALYHVFRPAGAAISSLTAWFRIVYTIFLGTAALFLFAVLELVGGGADVAALDQPTREAHTMLALDAFNATWLIGLTCFGVHLALLGAMSVRSTVAPRLLGTVLLVAGAAYVFDTLAYSLLDSYSDHEALFTTVVALPAVVAEASLMVWLLRRARCLRADDLASPHLDDRPALVARP